jgi:hypothetical protein
MAVITPPVAPPTHGACGSLFRQRHAAAAADEKPLPCWRRWIAPDAAGVCARHQRGGRGCGGTAVMQLAHAGCCAVHASLSYDMASMASAASAWRSRSTAGHSAVRCGVCCGQTAAKKCGCHHRGAATRIISSNEKGGGVARGSSTARAFDDTADDTYRTRACACRGKRTAMACLAFVRVCALVCSAQLLGRTCACTSCQRCGSHDQRLRACSSSSVSEQPAASGAAACQTRSVPGSTPLAAHAAKDAPANGPCTSPLCGWR